MHPELLLDDPDPLLEELEDEEDGELLDELLGEELELLEEEGPLEELDEGDELLEEELGLLLLDDELDEELSLLEELEEGDELLLDDEGLDDELLDESGPLEDELLGAALLEEDCGPLAEELLEDESGMLEEELLESGTIGLLVPGTSPVAGFCQKKSGTADEREKKPPGLPSPRSAFYPCQWKKKVCRRKLLPNRHSANQLRRKNVFRHVSLLKHTFTHRPSVMDDSIRRFRRDTCGPRKQIFLARLDFFRAGLTIRDRLPGIRWKLKLLSGIVQP